LNLAQLLVRAARTWPERPALFHGEDLVFNYRELGERAARVAGYLHHELGLLPGARVGLFMANCPQYLELIYGAWIAGLAVVPINTKLHPKEAVYILADAGAEVLFADEEHAREVAPLRADLPACRAVIEPGSAGYAAAVRSAPLAPVDRDSEDLAWLFYTSGTTGRPKGVMLSHRNLSAMIACHFMDVGPAEAEDTMLYAAPMSHAAGMGNFAHMCVGARHVVARSPSFEPAEILALAARFGRVFTFAAPTIVKRLAEYVEESGADPSGFKTILYGGGPMYVEDLRHAVRFMGQRFAQIYGQGESPMTITALSREHIADTTHPRHEHRIGSVGVAQTLVEVRVTDAEGRPLPAGEVGEILVRGDTVMKGYWRNPEATARTIRGAGCSPATWGAWTRTDS
jgi:long-chain acyl-CoA synthetase